MANLTKTLESVKASFSQYSTPELVAWRESLSEHEGVPIHSMVKEMISDEIKRRDISEVNNGRS